MRSTRENWYQSTIEEGSENHHYGAMSRPTIQVETTTKALLAAGLRRSDFRCYTDRKRRILGGVRFTEYGDAFVSVHLPSEKLLPFVPSLVAQGLCASIIVMEARISIGVRTSYADRGKLRVLGFNKDGPVEKTFGTLLGRTR